LSHVPYRNVKHRIGQKIKSLPDVLSQASLHFCQSDDDIITAPKNKKPINIVPVYPSEK